MFLPGSGTSQRRGHEASSETSSSAPTTTPGRSLTAWCSMSAAPNRKLSSRPRRQPRPALRHKFRRQADSGLDRESCAPSRTYLDIMTELHGRFGTRVRVGVLGRLCKGRRIRSRVWAIGFPCGLVGPQLADPARYGRCNAGIPAIRPRCSSPAAGSTSFTISKSRRTTRSRRSPRPSCTRSISPSSGSCATVAHYYTAVHGGRSGRAAMGATAQEAQRESYLRRFADQERPRLSESLLRRFFRAAHPRKRCPCLRIARTRRRARLAILLRIGAAGSLGDGVAGFSGPAPPQNCRWMPPLSTASTRGAGSGSAIRSLIAAISLVYTLSSYGSSLTSRTHPKATRGGDLERQYG